jgi:hypothetical protein
MARGRSDLHRSEASEDRLPDLDAAGDIWYEVNTFTPI